MALTEADRRNLWARAGRRCSICKRHLTRDQASVQVGMEFGVELPIIETNQTVGSINLDDCSNYILLCHRDGRIVLDNRRDFDSATLARLKLAHEESMAKITGDDFSEVTRPSVSLLVHTAVFVPGSVHHFFLKITNQSRHTIVQLNRIWFATNPDAVVENRDRPLPTLLAPGDMFETWKPTSEVPVAPNLDFLGRVELDDRTVIASRPNSSVSPAGSVGGGGRPLTALAESVAAINHVDGQLIRKEWDVFISHSSEDKAALVRPLADALRQRGLRVWYDEFELRLGDSLRQNIDLGIAKSAFGVIVLSPAFLRQKRGWTNYELDGLVTRSVTGDQVILPLWHGVGHEQVLGFSPSLADRVARDTGTNTIDQIATDIHEIVRRATTIR